MADAIATVLATYMVGLSLGAFLGGKLADRVKSPLRFYAIAELVIAATVVLLPWGRDLIMDIYVSAVRSGIGETTTSLLRVSLSALLILPPTLAMGATLPLLVADWMRGRDSQATRAVPRLYGANTLGRLWAC
jgi:spermidine synthase